MACDERLVQRVRQALATQPGLPAMAERRMFGGVAFLVGGHMAVGVSGDELMVRVGPAAHADALAQPGARPMDFTGRPMKGYVFVAPSALEPAPALAHWVAAGTAFVATLPSKP